VTHVATPIAAAPIATLTAPFLPALAIRPPLRKDF
jgi:hypothetical protein